MVVLELTSEERWILATALSRQVGVYAEKLKSENYSVGEGKYKASRIRSIAMDILLALQGVA
jgi:repressor of nif and glnA expression